MDKFLWTAIAVLVGIWAYAKITEDKAPTKRLGPAGYPIDQITGVEIKAGDRPGTVGFASGPIDNFRDPSDGALSGQDSWSVDYGQKL